MLFNSIGFMFFMPLVLVAYFCIPKRWRYILLLIASYFFYMCWDSQYAILIAFSTIVTYFGGVLLGYADEQQKNARIKKWIVIASVMCNIFVLGYFKYFEFGVRTIENILRTIGFEVSTHTFNIMLPVGISFYTFQALSYVIDVYKGEVKAEKNILKYALFVSFFPQLVAGPIERSKNLLKQVQEVHEIKLWNLERIISGAIYMIWGYFMKMVIADRAAILVDTVFDEYYMYGSVELVMAVVWFAIQIYCDFSGYSMIAIGMAKIMGFSLMENFDAPYFSQSIKEVWRRWHVSLSSWFRDYVYIPLGGNRKGKWKKYCNLMITFLVSGLWHGAEWSFVIWGGLHGLYQIIGELTLPIRSKISNALQVNTECFSHKLLKTFITFVLVCFAWIFFRADSVSVAFAYIGKIFTEANIWCLFDGTLYTLGLDQLEMKILVLSTILLFVVDWMKYHKKEMLDTVLLRQNTWFSWGCILGLIFVILVYGVYGPAYDATQFIYFQF